MSVPNYSRRTPRTRDRPVAVDLFSGAGGMSLGFEQAGFDVVAALEYDPVHAATHAFNFPFCEVLCRDAARITGDMILVAAKTGLSRLYPRREWSGKVDAIIGGPPCQGFSTGGKREDDDDRNSLLLHFVRLVEQVRPRTFCLENVSGLLESRFDSIRGEAFGRLARVGYAISGNQRPLNALDFGLPQSRRRIVVLGALGRVSPAIPRQLMEVVSVRDAFEGLADPSHYDELLSSDEVELGPKDLELRASIAGAYASRLAGVDAVPGDKSRPRIWNPANMTGSRRTMHTATTVVRFDATEPGTVEPRSRLYRLPLDGPSRTLRAGTGSERGSHTSPRPIHPTESRVITVREAARIHGFPDWFRFHTTNWHGHRQVGNSVPPPMARAAADSLLDALGCTPRILHRGIPLGDCSLLSLSRTKAQAVVGGLEDELPPTRVRSS